MKGCPDCGSSNQSHYSWCKLRSCCGTSNNSHYSWCTAHLGDKK
jgi:hypothetical protein